MKSDQPGLKAIIFDVDGTLADTEEVHRLAFNESFARFGLNWHWSPEQYISLLSISGGRTRIRTFAEQHRHDAAVPKDIDAFARQLHRDKSKRYQRMLVEGHVSLRPGVLRLLQEARGAHVRLGIATSTALANVHTLLDQNLPAGWTDWFDCIATCEELGVQKPDPAIYRHVLQQLDVAATQTVAIEDTENGLRSASAAGLKTIITQHYFTQFHDFSTAALVVSDLGEADAPMEWIAGNPGYRQNQVDIGLLGRLLDTDHHHQRRSSKRLQDQTSAVDPS